MTHNAGLERRARQMNDGTDDALDRNSRCDDTVGIDRRERQSFERAGKSMKEPPRYAIHRGDDRRLRMCQGSCDRRHASHRGTFDRDDDIILRLQFGRVAHGTNRRRDRLAADLQSPAMLAQRRSRRVSRNGRHVDACMREPRSDQPTDCASANDADFHQAFGRLSTTRFALPSERSMPPLATICTDAVTPIRFLIRCASVAPAASPSA